MKNIQDEIIQKVTSDLYDKLEALIIEGLKRKGFVFSTYEETCLFVKQNCRKTENIQQKKHIYYVNNIPFFLHKYEVIYEPITEDNNGIKITANYGEYAFL